MARRANDKHELVIEATIKRILLDKSLPVDHISSEFAIRENVPYIINIYLEELKRLGGDPTEQERIAINLRINTQQTSREIDRIIRGGGDAGQILNLIAKKILNEQ